MPNLDLTGAQVLGPDGLHGDRLSFLDGRIFEDTVGQSVNLRGYLVLPGIVDIHGDGFERHMAPRRGAMKLLSDGLVAAETELAANGLTTAVLAQFISWEGGLRGLDFAEQVFAAIRGTAHGLVTDIRAQLRFETHLLDLFDSLPERLSAWGVDYVVFNDHLPHDRLREGRKPPRLVGQALKAGRNPDAHFELLLQLHGQHEAVPEALDALCARLLENGVRMGSHDDATSAGRAAWQKRGVHIAEFPETIEAAESTIASGNCVVLGAPNVVRGGSHAGNVSAVDLIAMGLCTALASDYHYPSPRRAALMLAESGVLDLKAAWKLVSSGPAQILGLHDRGQLVPGQRADLLILDAQTKRVAATLCRGRFSYLSGDIAERFI
jgi:alpha-D-ribose 1-methylphosphonate 5-triphosphate diphosphatase